MAQRQIPIPESSNLQSVVYDDEAMELIVVFHGVSGGKAKSPKYANATYLFKSVPSNVVDGLATSGLRATDYFRSNIYRQYIHERIS
jgi:hypothetical protein